MVCFRQRDAQLRVVGVEAILPVRWPPRFGVRHLQTNVILKAPYSLLAREPQKYMTSH